ncbi:NADH-quinone oxidoreductase subunit NuoE [Desulfuribacillus alkaliarsenatis]|uniref:NADH dehydrogenase n=1 Tax=Desulfuribacillus alkaliarsenatis TaxID=766136 RepID=A0A1E5G6B7_9FIRM|nr:NADH-quinone oxidoreductase subunit NuoE [Desulfuribacillus alkaliarsenatis]OEF98722.1 NADH dehydrogenase [Desulfuribacillus alkaliarsenatis]
MCELKCNTEHPEVANIIEAHRNNPGALIIVLQKAQSVVGYLPKEIIKQIATGMNLSESKVYGVATFYSQFHLTPRGENIIRVCMGTACHVRGAVTILEKLQEQLHIKSGETSKDLKFTLETVACIGACGLAPVITINDDTYGKLKPSQLKDIINKYR